MAAFAGIEIWRCCELAGVLVLVAVGAVLKLHFEHRVGAARDVALFASDLGVRALQWICRRRVIGQGERRGLPTVDRVTSGAFAPVWTLRELPLVRIVLVTVGAFLERDRLLEISATVALDAADHSVLPQ